MPWFQVDDQLAFHTKTLAAGNEAMGMWVRAGSWCRQQLNDGFIPPEMVAALGGETLALKLVSAGLWTKVRTGFRFHEWDERQLSKTEIENRRRMRQEAGRMGGVKSGQTRRGSKNEASASAKTKQHTEQQLQHMLNDSGTPVPVPTPKGVDLGGESHLSNAQGEPPRKCSAHINDPTDRPCRGCGDARQAHEAWTAGQTRVKAAARSEAARTDAETRAQAITMCDLCDQDGYQGLALCDHDPGTADRAQRGIALVRAALKNRETGVA